MQSLFPQVNKTETFLHMHSVPFLSVSTLSLFNFSMLILPINIIVKKWTEFMYLYLRIQFISTLLVPSMDYLWKKITIQLYRSIYDPNDGLMTFKHRENPMIYFQNKIITYENWIIVCFKTAAFVDYESQSRVSFLLLYYFHLEWFLVGC